MGKVHPNLMSPSRLDYHLDERNLPEHHLKPPRGECIPAAGYNSHLLAIFGMPLNRSGEFSRRLAQAAMNQSGVFFVNTLFFELFTEMTVSVIVFRHHDDAAGIFIEPMDDPGPQGSPQISQVITMMEETVYKG